MITKCPYCGCNKPEDVNPWHRCSRCGKSLVACTTQDATQIGSQRIRPNSVSKIQAETKQLREELDLAGEQRNDDQVVAVRNDPP